MERKTIAELRQLNRASGRYFFDRDALRAFHSIVYRNVRTGTKHWYFITSEGYSGLQRRYTVRKMDVEGRVTTAGRFREHTTFDDALEAAIDYAREDKCSNSG